MNMTPDQLAQLQAMIAQRSQAPQGAIQQAQGAPMVLQGMPHPQGLPPQGTPPQMAPVDAKKAVMDKISALSPADQAKFKDALMQQMRQGKK